MTVQAGLCRTWSEPKLLVFSRTGSNESYGLVGFKTGVITGTTTVILVISTKDARVQAGVCVCGGGGGADDN